MRMVVTVPVTELSQVVEAQMSGLRSLMIFGLAKPMDTWYPAGPYSWKKLGSLTRRKESWAFWPSKVLVWSHSSPLAIRSAPGVATTPYLPGIKLAMTAWPANGDRVLPSASYFGQVTIVPVIPVCVGSSTGLWVIGSSIGLPFASLSVPIREILDIGHASILLFDGSGVPARLFDNG